MIGIEDFFYERRERIKGTNMDWGDLSDWAERLEDELMELRPELAKERSERDKEFI